MTVPNWVQMIAIASACAGVSPIVSALAIQWQWPSWVKTVVGLVIAGLGAFAGVAALAPAPPESIAEWVVFAVAVVTATQGAYRLLWKPAGVERVEAATSIAGPAGTTSAGF